MIAYMQANSDTSGCSNTVCLTEADPVVSFKHAHVQGVPAASLLLLRCRFTMCSTIHQKAGLGARASSVLNIYSSICPHLGQVSKFCAVGRCQ